MEEALHRLAKHLPPRRLLGHLPPEDRISIDRLGNAWVTEDLTLIILKGQLLVEAALVDICARLLANPATLEKERFSTRLNLVRALLDDDILPENIWHALRHLNSIRNALAHNLEPKNIEAMLCQFFEQLDEFEDFASLYDDKEGIPTRLTRCIAFLSGVLSNIGKPKNEPWRYAFPEVA
jgi:uncharacterized protein YutE (UPF0331/DUF86 family)